MVVMVKVHICDCGWIQSEAEVGRRLEDTGETLLQGCSETKDCLDVWSR